jgi:hypothetical protein
VFSAFAAEAFFDRAQNVGAPGADGGGQRQSQDD